MSDAGEEGLLIFHTNVGPDELAQVQSYSVLPKDILDNAGSIKLFNKWDYSGPWLQPM